MIMAGRRKDRDPLAAWNEGVPDEPLSMQSLPKLVGKIQEFRLSAQRQRERRHPVLRLDHHRSDSGVEMSVSRRNQLTNSPAGK